MTYSTKGVESEIMSRREGQNKNIHVTGRTFLHMSYVLMQTRAGIGGNLCVRLFFGLMGAWWWVGGFQDRWAACLPHTSLIPPFANKANCLGHHPCLCIERAREAAIWCQPSADAWYLAGGGPRSCDRGRMFGQELGRDWFCLSNKCKPESPEGLMRSPSFRHCRQWKKGGRDWRFGFVFVFLWSRGFSNHLHQKNDHHFLFYTCMSRNLFTHQ